MEKGLVLHPGLPEYRQELIRVCGGRCQLVFKEDSWDEKRLLEEMAQADFLLGEPKREDLAVCRKLKWMQSPSSGVNYYMGYFPEGARLSCMTGNYGNILAEHMLGMCLSLCRRLPEYRDIQHTGQWKRLYYDKQLEGSTVLILGAGDIGTTLASWMRPMVGKIIGVRRHVRQYPACYDEMVTLAQLDAVLPQADIILCALPHTKETAGLLDKRRLSLTKADCVLVNGGRGSLIDQEALNELLNQGHFWGVGLEVTDPEPLPESSPLWRQKRVLITPHAAGNTFAPGSALDRKIWKFLIRNTDNYLSGKEPENLVDFDAGYRRYASSNF